MKHKVNMQLRQVLQAPTIAEFEADMIEGEWYPEDNFDYNDDYEFPGHWRMLDLALEKHEEENKNWPSRLGDVL
jgi:hypothetical protein